MISYFPLGYRVHVAFPESSQHQEFNSKGVGLAWNKPRGCVDLGGLDWARKAGQRAGPLPGLI